MGQYVFASKGPLQHVMVRIVPPETKLGMQSVCYEMSRSHGSIVSVVLRRSWLMPSKRVRSELMTLEPCSNGPRENKPRRGLDSNAGKTKWTESYLHITNCCIYKTRLFGCRCRCNTMKKPMNKVNEPNVGPHKSTQKK